MCIFDRHDIEERELSPLRDLSESSQSMSTALTPGAKGGRRCGGRFGRWRRWDESIGSKARLAHCGPEILALGISPEHSHTQPNRRHRSWTAQLIVKHPHLLNTPWHSLVSASGLHP
jgi:hypothetical protein